MVSQQERDRLASHSAVKIRNLPSFFIIGPPRTGTSWLHSVLSQRAWLSHPTKETRFFDRHFHRGLEWYGAHYRKAAADRPAGEVAPTYFASSAARERIARLIPHARVVCTFRDPVDRLLSLYRLKRAYGLIPWSFQDSIARDPELIESSRYADHLKAWQNTLGCAQVLATFYDDMQRDPQSYLNTLTDFVGVPPFQMTAAHLRRVFGSEGMTEPRSYYWTRSAVLLADWRDPVALTGSLPRPSNWAQLNYLSAEAHPSPTCRPPNATSCAKSFVRRWRNSKRC